MTDPVTQNDALGGGGSLEPALQAIAVNGISRAVDGFLSTKYPLTFFNEPYTSEGAGAFEPGGRLAPRGAPGWTTGYGAAAPATSPSFLATPIGLGLAALAIIAVVVVLARK